MLAIYFAAEQKAANPKQFAFKFACQKTF